MNHDVFISYSSVQQKVAVDLCKYLERCGVKCWMAPRDIPAGYDYGDLIEEAINHARIFLLVFSRDASLSLWVKGEINTAFSNQKIIMPYRIDETPLKGGLKVMLNQFHWLDAYGSDSLAQAQVLVDNICGVLGRPSRQPSVTPINNTGHLWSVVLRDAGAAKLQVVKAVKESCGLGLKEAKDLVDGVPSTIGEGLTRNEALSLKHAIEQAGAILDLTESLHGPIISRSATVSSPSLSASELSSQADKLYDAGKFSEALKLYIQAYNTNESYRYRATDCNRIGLIYDEGKGVDEDDAEAVRWYRRGAELGNSYAQSNLGLMYEYGTGVRQDFDEAMRWFRKAADQGHEKAKTHLADLQKKQGGSQAVGASLTGTPEEWSRKGDDYYDAKNYSEALRLYLAAAEKGVTKNYNRIGYMYRNGEGTQVDCTKAVYWYRRSADNGFDVAQRNLGTMYGSGLGVAQDYKEAMKWFRRAADQGNAEAMVDLGLLYENGNGVAKDETEAVRWYSKAAEKNNPYGQCNLGYMYEKGRGVAQDYGEALKWYLKAASQGHQRGRSCIADLYYYGRGVTKDYAEAAKRYRQLANEGRAYDQYSLGWMYEHGQGVAKDMDEALRWYRKAASQGNSGAQKRLRELGQSA